MSKRRVPMARTLLSTCRHEAAHAVLLEELGGKVLWVQVVGQGNGTMCPSRRKLGPLSGSMVVMAGTVAENLWHGVPRGYISGQDCEDLREMGLSAEDMRQLWFATARMVRKNKTKIWALAKRLMSGKKVKP